MRFNLFTFFTFALCAVQAIASFAAVDDKVAAVVNDTVITQGDIQHEIALFEAQANQPLPAQLAQDRALSFLIDSELKRQAAKRFGVEVNPAQVETMWQRNVEANPSLTSAPAWLQQLIKTQLERDIQWSRVLDRQVRPRIDVSDAEVNQLLQGLLAGTTGVTEYHISHILRPLQSDDETQSSQEELNALRQKIISGELSFEDAKGVDLGWLTSAEIAPSLSEIVQNLPVGVVSEPVQSDAGWHLLYLNEKRQAPEPDAAKKLEISERIRENLFKRRFTMAEQRLLRDLRRQAYIDVRI